MAPSIPYSVPELFRANGNILAISAFVLALLWIGAGATWLSDRLRRSPMPTTAIRAAYRTRRADQPGAAVVGRYQRKHQRHCRIAKPVLVRHQQECLGRLLAWTISPTQPTVGYQLPGNLRSLLGTLYAPNRYAWTDELRADAGYPRAIPSAWAVGATRLGRLCRAALWLCKPSLSTGARPTISTN